MSFFSDEFKPTVNTFEEVKKLQELVRKLEIQNLHLRNKQNSSKRLSSSPTKELKTSSQSNRKNSESTEDDDSHKTESTNKEEYFDDLDIIRVSDIELSDDESWLYISPKSKKGESKTESPYNWLRKDVDDPENEHLQYTKTALLTKLNELDIFSSTSMLSSNHAENPTISNLKRSQLLHKTSLSTPSHDSAFIDSRTFTRSKKKQAIDFLEKLDMLNSEKTDKNSFIAQMHRRGSDISSDSISSCHILEDVSDVEEAARLQEESLRMGSPLCTPKRNAGNLSLRKISSSSRGSASDHDTSECSVVDILAAEDSSGHGFSENYSYAIESYNHSDHSSPSESPYSSNISLHNSDKVTGKLSGYRRSLPNLNREPLTVRQSKSHSAGIRQSQVKANFGKKTDAYMQNTYKVKRDSKSTLASKKINETSPVSNFQMMANFENMKSESKNTETPNLRAKSGLPRPSRASSASRSVVRSGIPTPSLSKKQVEDSWRDGCF